MTNGTTVYFYDLETSGFSPASARVMCKMGIEYELERKGVKVGVNGTVGNDSLKW